MTKNISSGNVLGGSGNVMDTANKGVNMAFRKVVQNAPTLMLTLGVAGIRSDLKLYNFIQTGFPGSDLAISCLDLMKEAMFQEKVYLTELKERGIEI